MTQYRFFTIPIQAPTDGGGTEPFSDIHRILAVERRLCAGGTDSLWAVCVGFDAAAGDAPAPTRKRRSARGSTTKRCSTRRTSPSIAELRALRKSCAEREGVPAYKLFTNEQLAEMVTRRVAALAALRDSPASARHASSKYGAAVPGRVDKTWPAACRRVRRLRPAGTRRCDVAPSRSRRSRTGTTWPRPFTAPRSASATVPTCSALPPISTASSAGCAREILAGTRRGSAMPAASASATRSRASSTPPAFASACCTMPSWPISARYSTARWSTTPTPAASARARWRRCSAPSSTRDACPGGAKIDIRAYFASIDHGVLKALLARKFKDRGLLALLGRIIDAHARRARAGAAHRRADLAAVRQFLSRRAGPAAAGTLPGARHRALHGRPGLVGRQPRRRSAGALDTARAFAAGSLLLAVKPPVRSGAAANGLDVLRLPHPAGAGCCLSRRRRRRYAELPPVLGAGAMRPAASMRRRCRRATQRAGRITLHADAAVWRREQLRRVPLAAALTAL